MLKSVDEGHEEGSAGYLASDDCGEEKLVRSVESKVEIAEMEAVVPSPALASIDDEREGAVATHNKQTDAEGLATSF